MHRTSLLLTVTALLVGGSAHAEEAAGPRTYAVEVVMNAKEKSADKLVFDGTSVQLDALKKLGFAKVGVTTSRMRDFLRLKLPSAGKDLKTFHAVLKDAGTVEGLFVVLDAKRNKQTYQFKGKLAP